MSTRAQHYGSATDRVAAMLANVASRVETLELLGGGGGAPPAPGEGTSYQHTQGTPASVWTITHGLGYQPAVTVTDSTGDEVEGDLAYPDANTVVITFSAAFSGTAYLS